MNNITFGQFYPASSFIHKLDARTKLVATFVYIVLVFLANSYSGYAVLTALLLAAIFSSRVPLLTVLRSVKTVLFLVVFATVLNIFFTKTGRVLIDWRVVGSWHIVVTDEGLYFASYMILRLLLLVTGTALLTLTTTPTALTDGIEAVMSPLKKLHVPIHDIAIIMSIALRFIPNLMEETDKILKAQKSRGACFDEGGLISRARALLPVLIPLFVSSFRRADELGDALDARCYNATDNRTKYKKMVYTYRDALAVVGLIVFAALLIVDRFVLGGLF